MEYRKEYTTTTTPGHEKVSYPEHESVIDLIKDFRDEVMLLARQEMELAKTEMNEKLSRITSNVTALAIGAIISFASLIVILGGLSVLLAWAFAAAGLSVPVAVFVGLFIIGGVAGIVGLILLIKGMSTIRKTSIVPEKTVHSLKEDQIWMRKRN